MNPECTWNRLINNPLYNFKTKKTYLLDPKIFNLTL